MHPFAVAKIFLLVSAQEVDDSYLPAGGLGRHATVQQGLEVLSKVDYLEDVESNTSWQEWSSSLKNDWLNTCRTHRKSTKNRSKINTKAPKKSAGCSSLAKLLNGC